MNRQTLRPLASILVCSLWGCGSAAPSRPPLPLRPLTSDWAPETAKTTPPKERPPASGEPTDVSFPPIERSTLDNGLEVNTVEWHRLPIVYIHLVIKSGGEADPKNLPGLSRLTAQMLKEGTRRRTSATLAEDVEFLGARLDTYSDEENIYITMRALSEHLDEALAIVSEVATSPSFPAGELRKLQQRELDRLRHEANDPNFLARREFYRALYGEHPYAHVDTTPDAVKRMRTANLKAFHRKYFVPSNAFLVVVGDTDAKRVGKATATFRRWRGRSVARKPYPEPPSRDGRTVILVDRPDSVQSVIRIGNLTVKRASPDYVPLLVANQVLGGSAASRLFMDLREKRSLTYGAYSQVGERVEEAPFVATASVRTSVTKEALAAFFEHLDRIVSEPTPPEELLDAQRYLSDSFPLRIDTPGKIADLVSDLRIYGLTDEYWDRFRGRIWQVSAPGALKAAQAHIHPDKALIVVVGQAASILEPLRTYGPVTVLSTSGEVLHEAAPSAAPEKTTTP